METSANEHDLADFLPWLVAMGADEVVLDQPVNRFAAAAAPAVDVPKAAQPILQPRPATPPRQATNWLAPATGAEGVAAAEALAQSITNLDDYVEAVSNFDKHPLKKTASRACALSGNLNARILLLCDRPRNDEDRSGVVLAGNNRILAQRMLAAIGQTVFAEDQAKDTVVLASFIPWRPPGNRNPTELEAQMMVPLVRKLVGLLQPQAILCFGPLAGQYLSGGEEAIMKARSTWLSVEGCPLLTTFHPETLLKSAASKRLAWHDLQLFRQKLANVA